MKYSDLSVSIFDISSILAGAVDLISPTVSGHNKQVAYIIYALSKVLGFERKKTNNLILAGTLHDIGAISIKETISALDFEYNFDNPTKNHAYAGYQLLKIAPSFTFIAECVQHHHDYWGTWQGDGPEESHLIHLADRISVLINPGKEILSQVDMITGSIRRNTPRMFKPEYVEAFIHLSRTEAFWFDLMNPTVLNSTSKINRLEPCYLDFSELLKIMEIFAYVIDFRSRFTATHTSGVAVVAEKLALLSGCSEMDARALKVAAYFHDIGKLAVPPEILNKPSELTREESNIIRSHTYHSYRLLEGVEPLAQINTWASLHHEHLDGNGYPFHMKKDEIPLGTRIMTVADIFSAITEDRPYRPGMDRENVISTFRSLVRENKVDREVASLLLNNREEIHHIHSLAQHEALKNYTILPHEDMEKN